MWPCNRRFATENREPAFAPRAALAGADARTLAREILQMSQEELSAAFNGSPMKRAKPRGSKPGAAVVLGNVGAAEDADALARVPGEEPDLMARDHAARAVVRIDGKSAATTAGGSSPERRISSQSSP